MGYLSFNLQLQGRPIIIVGGGSVARRKTMNILPAGADLTIISPTLNYELQQLRDGGQIRHLPRGFQPGDLAGAFLVIAATNDREVNRAVAEEARSLGVLAEITDDPGAGTVTSPAVIRQGDLSVAISTNNRAPALAAVLKKELAAVVGPEYARAVQVIGAIREKLLTRKAPPSYNKQVLSDLAEQLPPLLASGADAEIDSLLRQRLGADFSMASLDADLEGST
jgi:precorrin-2 dehydrogenase/sirohydrochlorin ferrochelatase